MLKGGDVPLGRVSSVWDAPESGGDVPLGGVVSAGDALGSDFWLLWPPQALDPNESYLEGLAFTPEHLGAAVPLTSPGRAEHRGDLGTPGGLCCSQPLFCSDIGERRASSCIPQLHPVAPRSQPGCHWRLEVLAGTGRAGLCVRGLPGRRPNEHRDSTGGDWRGVTATGK